MNPLTKIVEVATRDLGLREIKPNQNPAFQKFWDATWYPEGMKDQAPYCAAACSYWVQTAAKEDSKISLVVQPRFCAVADWLKYGNDPIHGCIVFPPRHQDYRPNAGDLVIYESFSHVGVVEKPISDILFSTIEANTSSGETGSQRDGDGVHRRTRNIALVKSFIRLPVKGTKVYA